MKKNSFFICCVLSLCLLQANKIAAQNTKHKIAIFAPLYLDSAYIDDSTYRYAKNVFPKFINPGLEFYEGAQLALDSLNLENTELEVFVYDTRSASESLFDQLHKPELDSVELILAHCNSSEVKLFADAGLRKNIPVINVNLPNDGGVSANPFLVLMNSTLRTQCEGIYRHIQKYYALNRLIVFRKKGSMEERIKQYFDDFGKNTMSVPLKLKYVELPDSFTVNNLKGYLDTIEQSLCISGSLDEAFGKRLVQQLALAKKQKLLASVMGMPTWDNIKDFNKPEYKGIEIIYPTPFYNPKLDKVSMGITAWFSRVMYMKPSDMVYRGYETTWRWTKMLLLYGKDLASNITSKQIKVFTEFDVQPVVNKQNMTLDYFENKKLYFLKWQDGIIKAVY